MTAIDLEAVGRGALAVVRANAPEVVRRRLYLEVYAGGYRGGRRHQRLEALAAVDRRFVAAIEAANTHTVTTAIDVISHYDGYAVCLMNDVRVLVPRAHLTRTDGGVHELRVPALTLGPSAGHIALGGVAGGAVAPLTRIYLNAGPHIIPRLLEELPRQLNARHVRFWLKALAHPSSYYRRDSVVLYVNTLELQEGLACCRSTLVTLDARLRAGTPLLTMPVGRGIGIADDPDDIVVDEAERSHGLVVADWLLQATTGETTVDGFATKLSQVIEAAGRDAASPHLRGPRAA